MKDTIAAIATGVSNAGISIVRISGKDAITVIDRIFISKSGKKMTDVPSHTIHYGVIEQKGQLIDEVLVMVMRAPRSYTSEDTIEINCHGGVLVTSRVLDTVLENGARPADPGEFTKRAFLNGRIDLSQAEAVMDVINAQNEFALKSSLNQLKGSVHEIVKEIRSQVLDQIAFIETALDDPEHYELDHYGETLRPVIDQLQMQMKDLLKRSNNGKILKEGIKTVIVGKPNAGKSSLLNLLLGEDRAIVTSVAGTTRDTLEETILLNGIPLRLIDTAGIRQTNDIVEKIGVEKAISSIEDADLVIYVVDSASKLDESDQKIISMLQDKKVIILLNKTDLSVVITPEYIKERLQKKVISISAKEKTGIEQLEDEVRNMFFEGNLELNEEVYLTNSRHMYELKQALESLDLVKKSIDDGMSEDFFSIDLMNAYESLGNIIGESVGEDLVNRIFEKFCMGK